MKHDRNQWNSGSGHTSTISANNINNTYYSKDLRSHTIPASCYAHVWMFWQELYRRPEACKIWSCWLISRWVINWRHHFYSLTPISRYVRIVLPRNRNVILMLKDFYCTNAKSVLWQITLHTPKHGTSHSAVLPTKQILIDCVESRRICET